MKKVSIVIPTYNEKDNIGPLFKALQEVNKTINKTYKIEIIFIDDSSPDKTDKEIRRLKNNMPFPVQVIKREGKLGLGTAYIRGFKEALKNNADFIIQMDADLSHDPMSIPDMLKKFSQNNYSLVIGSRYIKGRILPKWSIIRKTISWGGNFYTRIILGFEVHDWTGGFNAYKKEVLEKINLDNVKSNGYSFQIEMKYKAKKAGFKLSEVPIHFYDRKAGKSKFSRNIFIEAFFNTLKLRFGLL